MAKITLRSILLIAPLVLSIPIISVAQQSSAAKPIVFAVLDDGKTLEPIVNLNKQKLEAPVNGSDDATAIAAFNKAYYKKGTAYKLIFGGASAGTVTVQSSEPKSDCGKNLATATTKTTKTPLKGFVMGLATNAPIKSTTSFRRKPTAAEKTEADALARAEFAKQKLSPKELRFQNLTAVDLENDGTPELVGTYWVDIDKLTRGLLFFIASKGSNGKYSVGFHDYKSVDQGKMMSGASISEVDKGVYHELLLDVFDTDGDGVSEIFTNVASFEGAGFNIYKRNGSKFTKAFEGSNYHCAF